MPAISMRLLLAEMHASAHTTPTTNNDENSNILMYGPALYLSAIQPTPELSLRCLQLLSIPAPRRL
jgi:hypothetical protein